MEGEVQSLLKSIQYGMLDFIEGEDEPDYSSEDVTACITLLLEFMSSMESDTQTIESAKDHVKALVLSLNELNHECGYSLIETDQREEICEFIQKTVTIVGVALNGDVTEEWREW